MPSSTSCPAGGTNSSGRRPISCWRVAPRTCSTAGFASRNRPSSSTMTIPSWAVSNTARKVASTASVSCGARTSLLIGRSAPARTARAAVRTSIKDPPPDGCDDRRRAIAHAQPVVDLLEMRLDRRGAQMQLGGDLRGRLAERDERKDLQLALAEPRSHELPASLKLPYEPGLDLRRDDRPSIGHDGDGVQDLVAVEILRHVPRRTGGQRLIDQVVLDVAGQDQDTRREAFAARDGDDLRPGHPGHPDVDDRDVGDQLADLLEGAPPVTRLADEFQRRALPHRSGDTPEKERMVVGQIHPDPRPRSHVLVLPTRPPLSDVTTTRSNRRM